MPALVPFSWFCRFLLLFYSVLACGCGRNPEGSFVGEVRDWEKWVFTGNLIDGGKEVSVELELRQGGERPGSAKLTVGDRFLEGAWSMDGAKRRMVFGEKVYYLSKLGAFHVLGAKDFKLANDDGSPVRLLLHKGRSTERGLKVQFSFAADGVVLFQNGTGLRHEGTWEKLEDDIVVSLKDKEKGEVHKFFFVWEKEDLLLKKLVILLGVGDKVGNEFGAPSRKSRSPKKIYENPPRFRRR